jgi:predicted glycoside hydrolase/deacetylase ChbG (UPF0249 family)
MFAPIKMKYINKLIQIFTFGFLVLLITACSNDQPVNEKKLEGANWAEKLGFSEGKKVLILHADDIGMCEEANTAGFAYLKNNQIQSAAIMVPCPNAEEAIAWAAESPGEDVGLHLTLTSEWKTYRWGSVADAKTVPGLIDQEGKLWRSVKEVVTNASVEEVEKEIRAQIDKAISMGMKPSHIDTHMGTLYAYSEYVKVFLRIAEEYKIPANAIDLSNEKVAEHFRNVGYPIDEDVIQTMNNYNLPKLDFFTSVPSGKTYEEKRENFFNLVKSLPVGLTEIIFHPSVETENLKMITNLWQQRVWEAKLFSDPIVNKFFKDENIVFTSWTDIMNRFNMVVN